MELDQYAKGLPLGGFFEERIDVDSVTGPHYH